MTCIPLLNVVEVNYVIIIKLDKVKNGIQFHRVDRLEFSYAEENNFPENQGV
jgi:hypothetical protein